MRLDCSWSMSIAGLTAQEICLPPQSLFLHSSQCHSMSRAKPSWKCDHDLDNFYFSVDASVNCNVQSRQQVPSFLTGDKHRVNSYSLHSPGAQPLPPKKSRPTQLCISSTFVSHTPSPVEDDQVVPGLQRLSVSDHISPPQTPSRAAKPLPPIPCSVDLSSDQTVDNELEFLSGDDSRCLVSDSCPKPSHFRYGMHSRRSLRDCGQINYAYFEGPVPHQRKQQQQSKKKHEHESQESLLPQQREPEQHEHHQHKTTCLRQQERAQRKLRRSHSGPAGSYNKPSALRLSCHQRNTQDLDKPEVPPRVPIPPRPIKTGDYRRWSAEVTAGTCSDDDRPPKVPPREPLSSCTPRAPSPKSLPIYLNGIMPPTQSFAPDPKYVSRGLQRQNSEGSPCILPIMENGRKASTTHYFLLPQRPTYLDKHEKYFVDSAASRTTEASGSNLDWSCDSKKKTHSELV
ncbi:ERBB receptor feedback inhibitor 1a [Pangasianodon hypophthalmus]|uniref:ERBB receptor feedback inhibitor 1a n=1 Tax=Pangasianodon hypophthalmus TaxID=310915 RepID=UPI000EFED44F|nr:ERBB receptor feedback inhibitor 1a [Pangasianodon hypophthalmus]XP_053083137.1 ERBB receptor feedback inhibitor 1a [Pangasianodon hypophthalmus]